MDVFSSSNSSFSIVNHRLMGGGVIHLECPKNRRGLGEPDMIILHYTAGSSAISSAKFLVRPDVKASAHVVIGRDGQVIQLVPFNIEAWHAGKSSYGGRSELNHYSIGIELDNAGELQRVGDRYYSCFGREYSPDQVYTTEEEGRARYWHSFTEGQFAVTEEICRLLKVCYGIKYLVRHSDITPRKTDPGPAFPFDELRKRLKF